MTLLAQVGHIFPRNAATDTVQTTMHFRASPRAVWDGMLFYEEIPQRPGAILRTFLPLPVRTRGAKHREGATIECTYDGGYLEKIITKTEPPHFVSFDVTLQKLGVEACISMTGGSYEIRPAADGGSDVVLTTGYHGHLRPRWLWRPFERYLAHRVHRHILVGMATVLDAAPGALPAKREAPALVAR